MIDIFGALKSVVSRKKTVTIDNSVFKLHYKFTALFLVAFSLIVSAFQYIGDPIDCMGYTNNIAGIAKVVEDFCWMQNTFIVPGSLHKEIGKVVPAPGIDQLPDDENEEQYKLYQTYYQFVGFVLLIQAIFFYLPHYLWKVMEGGRLRGLVMDLQSFTLSEVSRDKSLNVLVDYFKRYENRHQSYLLSFFFLEIMNFVNVVAQIFITDAFLGGNFISYGPNFFTSPTERIRVFPKLAQCFFHYFGPTMKVKTEDVLCALPLNVVNEKIYLFLWFWLFILALISFFQIVFRILTITLYPLRLMILRYRIRLLPPEYLDRIFSKNKAGDWFMMYQLTKNIEEYSLREFVLKLATNNHP